MVAMPTSRNIGCYQLGDCKMGGEANSPCGQLGKHNFPDRHNNKKNKTKKQQKTQKTNKNPPKKKPNKHKKQQKTKKNKLT